MKRAWKSSLPSLEQKKTRSIKYQWLVLDPSENGGYRANRHPEIWRVKCISRATVKIYPPKAQVAGTKNWQKCPDSYVEELLEAKLFTIYWHRNNSWEVFSSLSFSLFFSFKCCYYSFFKCVIEFVSEAIWAQTFIYDFLNSLREGTLPGLYFLEPCRFSSDDPRHLLWLSSRGRGRITILSPLKKAYS